MTTQSEITDGYLSPTDVAHLDRHKLIMEKYLSGAGVGEHSSHRRRLDVDFKDHRVYVPGDDIRFVDWQASARSEKTYIKQGEWQQRAFVNLLLDTSQSMNWGVDPKSRVQKGVAAILGYLTLANNDSLTIWPYNGQGGNKIGPLTGKGQVSTLLKSLNGLRYENAADLLPAAIQAINQNPRGGLIYILSDLWDEEDLSEVLTKLPVPKWQVVVFHTLHNEEVSPGLRGNNELMDVESGERLNYDITPKAIMTYQNKIIQWRDELEAICTDHQAKFVPIGTDMDHHNELIAYLRSAKVIAST